MFDAVYLDNKLTLYDEQLIQKIHLKMLEVVESY